MFVRFSSLKGFKFGWESELGKMFLAFGCERGKAAFLGGLLFVGFSDTIWRWGSFVNFPSEFKER